MHDERTQNKYIKNLSGNYVSVFLNFAVLFQLSF